MTSTTCQTKPSALKVPHEIQRLLACPVCKSPLTIGENGCTCASASCGANYPVVNGIPILINESASLFSIEDFLTSRPTTFKPQGKLLAFFNRWVPYLTKNYKAQANYKAFAERLLKENPHPRVLIVGGSIAGAGLGVLQSYPAIQLVETDVSFGPRGCVICDGHDQPFLDGSFDGVVIQAVLNCVADPYRCVEEAHRVLKDRGLIYTETSFMQPVLDGRYDFTRFTYLGYRRLFRKFEDIDSGGVGGPGMAIALLYRGMLLSFARRRVTRTALSLFAHLTAFWLKYIDYFLVEKPAALDVTSGCYFLGRKSDRALSDRQLIGLYRGSLLRIGEQLKSVNADAGAPA